MRNWLLPEYIEDILPAEAEAIERCAVACSITSPCTVTSWSAAAARTSRFAADRHRPRSRFADVQNGRPAFGTPAGPARRHYAASRAHRCAFAERARCDAPVLRRQRAAHAALRVGQTREALQIGAELYGDAAMARTRKCSGLLLSSLAAAGVRRPASRSRARRRLSRTRERCAHRRRRLDSELFSALRKKDMPAVTELTRPPGRCVARRVCRVADALWACP